jgi:ABC-2 type transport system permease protein
MRRASTELRFLFVTLLLEERSWWFGTLTISALFPLLLVFGMGLVGGARSPEELTYVVTGSVVVSLTTLGVTVLSQGLAGARERGELLYYASLPISKGSFIAALVAARLLMQLPGVAVALVGGGLIHGTPLAPNPTVLLVIPLAALSISGVGAAFGLLAPSYQATNGLSQLVLFVVLFASPVMIPAELLPAPLQWLGWLMPPTYAADALRRGLAGVLDGQFLLDVGVLAGFAGLSMVGITRGLPWRVA